MTDTASAEDTADAPRGIGGSAAGSEGIAGTVGPDIACEYVILNGYATGIHPKTARLVVIDAIVVDSSGNRIEDLHLVIDPGPDSDPGPTHYHGLSPEEVRAGKPFRKVLKRLNSLIDSRVLVLHDAATGWGFLVAEARRAMHSAARANRGGSSRSRRGRKDRARRRQRVGHVPRPRAIVDLLTTVYRRGVPITDTRPAAVARALGLPAPDPRASVARAQRSAADVSREVTDVLARTFAHLAADSGAPLVTLDPADLAADRRGLQRSSLRVKAAAATANAKNRTAPGEGDPPNPYRGLRAGMEFVVAPETAIPADRLIARGVEKRLHYSEKISRETSIVVCNRRDDLRGKAMHARRKGIPILSDEEFLAALDRLSEEKTGGGYSK